MFKKKNRTDRGIFHVHSTYSDDGKLTLEQLKEECIRRNLRFIFLTEHAENFDSEKMKDFVAHCRLISSEEFIVIPGLEFVLDVGSDTHLLVGGLTESLPANDIGSIAKFLENNEGVAVIAHPSRNNYYVPPEIIGKIDGIEIWNAAYDSRYLPDNRSFKLLQKLRRIQPNLLGFGGLDLHDSNGFRNVIISVIADFRNQNELLQCLKNGKFLIHNPFITIRPDTNMGIIKLGMLSLARWGLNIADIIKWSLAGIKAGIFKTYKKKSDHSSSSCI